MSKKLLSIFALFVLILALAPADALAQGGITGIFVQKGDTLSKIAGEIYGDLKASSAILNYHNLQAEKHPDLFTNISDPNVIEVGQIIALPDRADVSKYMSTDGAVNLLEMNPLEGGIPGRLLLVQEGNWLSKFAKVLYGDLKASSAILNYHNLQAEKHPDLFTYIRHYR